jgi:NAD(P)-dependent dehydrogenase (short-subunit alcohol dehydrogenase family)
MGSRKSIVIAGASSGIGAALTRALADDGHKLFICARRMDRLAQVVEGYDSVFHAGCDVGREGEVENFFRQVAERTDSLDVLIHCAAILGPIGVFNEVNSDEWIAAVRTNLFGAYLVAKNAVRLMKAERRPRIIILSGGGAFDPMPRVSAYGVSKAAIVRMVETLAVELAPRNIAVNAVAPGFVATEIHQATLAAGRERGGEHYDRTARLVSECDNSMDVPVNCIRYMISEAATRLTGKTISARYDPWGEPEFDQRIDQVMASPLYTTQRTVPAHLEDRALAEPLAQAVNNKLNRRVGKIIEYAGRTRANR